MSDQYQEAGNRGHSYIWEQRWEEAVEAFEFALQGRPSEPDLYDGLATAHKEIGHFGKALQNYEEAVRLSDGDVIYLEQVAEMQQKQGLYLKAADTCLAIGQKRFDERRIDDAVEKWALATHLNPDSKEAYEKLALVYTKQKRGFQAIHAHMEIARLYEEAGEAPKALRATKKALEIDPRNPDVLTAVEILRSGQKAFSDYKRATARTFTQGAELTIQEQKNRTVAPVEEALQQSREQLAEDIFTAGEEIPQALPVISQALDYQTRDLIEDAIQSYEQAVSMGFRSPATHFNLGVLYQEKLRFDDAINQFKTVLSSEEYVIACHFSLGESHRALGNTEEAILSFIDVLRLIDMTTVDASKHNHLSQQYENLATELLDSEDRDRASSFSNTLVEFLSGEEWQNNVASARQRLNGLSGESGLMILGDILAAGSSRVIESLHLAQQHDTAGLHDAAIEEVYRAIEINPTYLPAHMQIAELYIRKGLSSQATDKLMMVGKAFLIRDDINGAAQAYERAAKVDPFNLELRNDLINLLRKSGATNRAIQQYIGLGEAYYQTAQADEARQSYIQALKLSSKSDNEQKWRLQILRRIGDLDIQRFAWKQALPVYRELRRSAPDDLQILATYIDLHYKVGDKKQALREVDGYLVQLAKSGRGKQIAPALEKLIERRPADADITERLARLYVQQRNRKQAIAVLDRLGEAQLEAGNTHGAVKTIKRLLALKPANASDYQELIRELQG